MPSHSASVCLSGVAKAWGAFDGDELVGFISGEPGGGYWIETGTSGEQCPVHASCAVCASCACAESAAQCMHHVQCMHRVLLVSA